MEIEALAIPDVKVITLARHGDERGFLLETWRRERFAKVGLDFDFVQDNHSFSHEKCVVRGLHFQIPPFTQAKLVYVITGTVFDVAMDLRKGSPTFGRHVTMVLSGENGRQMLIPEGFAHGFCTLESNTHLVYKLSAPYSPEHDKGLLWNDPALGIDWPVAQNEAKLSPKDKALPLLADLPDCFVF